VRSAEDAAAYLNEDVYDLSFLAEGLARGGAASALLALLFEDLHGAHCCISEILSGMRAPGMETPAIESDAFLLLLREAARVEVPHDPEAHALCLVRILGRVASTRAPALREVA
jgi:hypothetical protein